jgi:hypothetical protein
MARRDGAGWRLIQLFAPALSGTGWASFVELVFEHPKVE